MSQQGSPDPDGRCRIGHKGKLYLRSRLIYAYEHGYFPKYVDHINRIRDR